MVVREPSRDRYPERGGPQPALIERYLPRYQASRVKHVVVDAEPDTLFEVIRSLDFHTAHTPVIDAALWVRDLPLRWRRRRGVDAETFAPPTPTSTRLADLDRRSPWVLLAESPPTEIVFGAVGKFWQPVIEWRWVQADGFARFHEPGYVKAAAGLSVRTHGEGRCLVSYQTRVAATDPRTSSRFDLYWRLIDPFVEMIERATLRAIKTAADA